MIIVHIYGGLGNQMFQYAMGRKLALKNQVSLKIDNAWYQLDVKEATAARRYELSHFNITAATATQRDIEKLLRPYPFPFQFIFDKVSTRLPFYKRRLVGERHFHFDPEMMKVEGSAYLRGYWQSEKYFADVREDLLKEFSFKASLDALNLQHAGRIGATDSVSLHVRRADYVTDKEVNRILGLCSLEYYERAVNYIRSKITRPVFFIFSDDMEWCRKNLLLPEETHFIDNNKGADSYRDMQLMSLCRHNIVANSSFSWWGAWLNQNPEKIVLAPQRWFTDASMTDRDLVPESWLRM